MRRAAQSLSRCRYEGDLWKAGRVGLVLRLGAAQNFEGDFTHFLDALACGAGGIQRHVGVQILNLLLVIVPPGASVRQNEVGVGLTGVAQKSLSSTLFGLVGTIQPQEGPSQNDVTIRGIRVEF